MAESQTPLIDLEAEAVQQTHEGPQQDSQQQHEDYSNMQLQTQVEELAYAPACQPPVICPPKIQIGKYKYYYEKSERGNLEVRVKVLGGGLTLLFLAMISVMWSVSYCVHFAAQL